MAMTVYKLAASVSATTEAAASLDVRRDGVLTAISLRMSVSGADALGDGGSAEVSFSSVSGMGVNDTLNSFAHVRTVQSFLTTGGAAVEDRQETGGLNIAVAGGERIYLHVGVAAAPSTVIVNCYLYVEDGARSLRDRTR